MGRKVLISFLGTGALNTENQNQRKYRTASYYFEGKKLEATSFVTKALSELLKPDVILIFGTMKSMWEALWIEENKSTDPKVEDDMFTLAEFCDEYNHKTPLNEGFLEKMKSCLDPKWKVKLIHYGIDDQQVSENFEIFKSALAELENNDEIILDITHSFRSLPIFANSAIEFINTVGSKNLKIVDIFYGMLDVSSEFGGKVPLVSLKYISEIQEWTKGAYTFINNGNADLISDLLKANKNNVHDKILKFSMSLSMNYMHEIKSQIAMLKTISNHEKYSGPSKMVIPVILTKFIKHFEKADTLSTYQLKLAEWHNLHHNHALSYLCLVEAIITYICEQEKLPTEGEKNRKTAKNILFKKQNYIKIKNIYDPANNIRKNAAHVTGQSKSKSFENVTNLNSYLKSLNQLLCS